MNRTIITLVTALTLVIPVVSTAQEADVAASNRLQVDVEIDPIAYVASGYSLHAGFGWNRYRVDLGAFAAEMPEFMHGNEDFEVGFDGYGAKFDVFWRTDRVGPFAGVQAGLVNVSVVEKASRIVDTDTRFQPGARIGWRIGMPADFYLTPWVGVDYAFGAADRVVAGKTFEEGHWSFFPTVHVGRRF
jgi:hypothetical protein